MSKIIIQGAAERQRKIHYEVDSSSEPIGEGGMGTVMSGIQVDEASGLTRPVAIKFMRDDLPPESIERARREASIQLRNDNLVEMLGFIETEDSNARGEVRKHYLVISELLHCIPLSDVLAGKCKDIYGNDIPFAVKMLQDYRNDPEHFAKVIVRNVLSGLIALHDAGYIHRDIDPSNIMLTFDEHIKLIDFGIAKQLGKLTTNDKALTVSGSFIGKVEYAAPELALGDLKHQNQTTDIYAMGILLYQCITGHTPFDGSKANILEQQLHGKINLKVIRDHRLREVISIAMSKKQSERYQSAAQMRVALENVEGMKREISKATKAKIIALATILVIIIIAAGIMISRTNTEEDVTITPPTPEEVFSKDVKLLSSNNPDSIRKGLNIMDSLGNKNFVPALYQLAFTYGWYSDKESLRRKSVLGVEVVDNANGNSSAYLPVQDKYTDIAVADFHKILEIADSAYADINANSAYRLACYYINSNKRFNRDFQEGQRLLVISRNWARLAKDYMLIKDIDNSLNTFNKKPEK